MMRSLLTACFLTLLSTVAWAQNRQITGQVNHQDTNDPIVGASVLIKGTTRGAQTDVAGRFKLDAPAGPVTLTIRYIGYKAKEVTVAADQTQVSIKLQDDAQQLNDVVAVGFATVKRRDLTGSVSSVTAKQLRDIPVASAGQALQGRLAGVQVTSSEGSPDADIKIRVRGGGSITQDNSPLYIIDGVQVENGLNSISPQDIESIDVLKDAASTSIYGARGANGVVIITTKGGREQKTTVNYNGYVGISKLARELKVLDPYEFVVYQYERNRFSPSSDSTQYIRNYGRSFDSLSRFKNVPFVDWQKIALGRTALQQQHNISVNGGSRTTQFNLSYTNDQHEGTVINSDYVRNLINFRFDHTVSDHLKVGFNARYNSQVVNGAGTSNASGSTYNNLRNSVKYRPFNLTGAADDVIDQAYLDETNAAGNNLGVLSPVVNANSQYRKNYQTVTNLNGYVNYSFNKYFSFRSTLGFDITSLKMNSFDDVYTANARINGNGQPLAGTVNSSINTMDISNVLTFNNAAAKSKHHDINLILGNEFYNYHTESLNNQFKLFPVGVDPVTALNQLNLGTIVPAFPQNTYATSHLLSFFGRGNYTLDRKYYFTFTFRADGSSKFASGKQWGYFPSGSFAWRVSDEKFMKNVKAVSDLKLRLSYGTSGNNRIPDYLFTPAFSANAFYGLNESTTAVGFVPTYLPNPNLKWETTVSKNIGVDMGILNNRIQISLDAYRNTTNDLLINVPVATSSGYATQLRNVGKTQNQGAEIQLNATIIQKKSFTYSTNFNISYNENKVLALAPGQTSYLQSSGWGVSGQPADFIVKVGQPVGSVWGYVSDGFYKTEDFNYNPATQVYTLKSGAVDPSKVIGVAQPGLVKFKDVNGDGVITEADKTVIGHTIPKITGGLNQQFTYKGIDLSVFVNFQLRGQVFNANKIEFTNGYTSNTNLLAQTADRWRTIDGSGNVVQRVSNGVVTGVAPDQLAAINANAKYSIPVTGSAAFYPTSSAVENASFLRLNNLTLGYSFKTDLLKKIKISKLRVYVTGNNLGLITGYSGYDPDVNARRGTPVTPGVDYSAYPRSRTYLFGVNLSL
ncbi:TonB-dependent receptor [Mucilaginibacter daejeonensis]|uniref:SusC/RagA family TonB-linked outer membrane protein n=1 Tax=Mucilaginibacter daejeonensis TaxID=398049 RepID=UPI001D172C02|nr:TonB-dependent receptor [Mucilaginibacter daejeonensis]UEG54818.1 TonB-dependent receptor [Mucilaginibacter daejeonensis]